MTRIISIDGNIGSGKSTIVKHLKDYYSISQNRGGLRICFLEEPVEIWNTIKNKEGQTMIECYYANPEKYAFAFQMMAYISRLATLKKEYQKNYDFIFTERCIFTDRNVFAKMLYDDGKIDELEHQIYEKWFNEFMEDFSDVEHIYIKTNPQVAFERIKKRDRAGENIPLEYLTRCHEYHERWLETSFGKCVIDGDVDTTNQPEMIPRWIRNIDNYIQMHVVTFDGASRGNPGPCGTGYVIKRNKQIIHEGNQFVAERNTNNYAEYCALILALKKCNELKIKNVIIMGDSNLIIKQMNKEYNVESPNLLPLHNLAIDETSEMNFIKFVHISRNKNEEADRLANLALNKWGKHRVPAIPIVDGMII